jgi:adenylate cyclase class 2
MTDQYQEIEVKFCVQAPAALEARLIAQGARLLQPRTYEHNLRFDTPNQSLDRQHQVLRLRQDQGIRLTFKGPRKISGGTASRQEIEFGVNDFEAARAFLQALGYQSNLIYEKYRTTYELDGQEITIDEMPFGNFAEIEGHPPESIQACAAKLGLDWDARLLEGYLEIFRRTKHALNLTFRDLTFENFADVDVSFEVLAVRAADIQ